MQVQVERTDKGLLIAIPDELADGFGFGDTVEVRRENGHLVVLSPNEPHHTIEELLEGMTADHLHEEIRVSPLRRSKYKIEDLMARVTEENLPDKIDFGPPVGRELL